MRKFALLFVVLALAACESDPVSTPVDAAASDTPDALDVEADAPEPLDVAADMPEPQDVAADVTESTDVEAPLDALPDAGATDVQTQTDCIFPEDDMSDADAETVVPDIEADVPPVTLGQLSPQQLHTMLETKDFPMIDVHVPYEGTIPQTDISISYLEVAAIAAYIGPDLNRHTVLTCKSGGMSTYAGNELIALGYKHIEHLTGGMMAWKAAGYTLVGP